MNNLGQVIIKIDNIILTNGKNKVMVSAKELLPGSYNVVVRKNAEFISKQILIIK